MESDANHPAVRRAWTRRRLRAHLLDLDSYQLCLDSVRLITGLEIDAHDRSGPGEGSQET